MLKRTCRNNFYEALLFRIKWCDKIQEKKHGQKQLSITFCGASVHHHCRMHDNDTPLIPYQKLSLLSRTSVVHKTHINAHGRAMYFGLLRLRPFCHSQQFSDIIRIFHALAGGIMPALHWCNSLHTDHFDADWFAAEKAVCCKMNLWHSENSSFISHTDYLCGHVSPRFQLLII